MNLKELKKIFIAVLIILFVFDIIMFTADKFESLFRRPLLIKDPNYQEKAPATESKHKQNK